MNQPDCDLRPEKWLLELADGTRFSGLSFGAATPVAGEVVFNTGMSGYVEALTDPSYRGQILVFSYPLVGNYGVPPARRAGSIARPYESPFIQAQGLVVQNYVGSYSHYAATRSLAEWLVAEKVPALTGVDTRALTRHLREYGVLPGRLIPAEPSGLEVRDVAGVCDLFMEVAPTDVTVHAAGDLRVMLIDCGAKDAIVRSLLERGATVIRVPWHHDLSAHTKEADAILIGNGPGDPAELGPLTDSIRNLLVSFPGPVFGVCLGHQILARAMGAQTYKLPYGHRGINQPVQNLQTQKCVITSQNHGYAVDDSSLPADWVTWFRNLNDGTNEGARSISRPHMSVQFHPEASPGPRDSSGLFDDFLSLTAAMRRSR